MSRIFLINSKNTFHLQKMYLFVDVEILRNCSKNQQTPKVKIVLSGLAVFYLICCDLVCCLCISGLFC